jgi:prefoldin beta subunit
MAMRFDDLPPQVQNQLKQMQQYQQQYEIVMQQRLQLDIRMKETENALEELQNLKDDTPIYKSIGNLIIRGEKEKSLKELKEEKESMEVRKKTFEGQETQLKQKIEELQTKLQENLKQ